MRMLRFENKKYTNIHFLYEYAHQMGNCNTKETIPSALPTSSGSQTCIFWNLQKGLRILVLLFRRKGQLRNNWIVSTLLSGARSTHTSDKRWNFPKKNHIRLVQELRISDIQKGIIFCYLLFQRVIEEHYFLRTYIRRHRSYFARNAMLHLHNW